MTRHPHCKVACGLVATLVAMTGCLGGGDPADKTGRVPGAEFLELEKRPVDLPSAPPGEFGGGCFRSEEMSVGAIGVPGIPEAALGPLEQLEEGPVYVGHYAGPPRVVRLSSAARVPGSTWWAIEMVWVSRSSYDGPVLVRGGRVDQRGRLGFGSGIRPREDLRLPAGSWPQRELELLRGPKRDIDQLNDRLDKARSEGWRATAVPTRIRVGATEHGGCFAFQVDGLGFSYVLPFGVQRR